MLKENNRVWGKRLSIGLILFLVTCIPSAAQPSAELTTSKFVYSPGETVTITFTNTGTTDIILSSSGPWVIKDRGGTAIYHPFAYTVVTTVKPGEALSWWWDQKDDNKIQVQEGTYTVELETSAGTFTATFEIRTYALATLTVQASDFRNPITGVPIKVWPPDINRRSDGETPFTREYHIGDRVILEAPLPDPNDCIWRGAPFHNWGIEKDAMYVQGSGGCYDRATMEIEITGPNPTVTAYFEGTPGPTTCAQLTTDKQVYKPGETVTLIFTNNCTYTIILQNDRPWRILDKDRKIVYTPEIVLPVQVKIDPGGTKTWEWDQKGVGKVRKQVEEGFYTAELDTDVETYSATFEIRACSPATLTVQASNLTNPITGVPIKVQPNDLNGQSAGNTPFTRRYCIGDRVTLEVQFTDALKCVWNNYVFQYWQVKKDARIVSLGGGCKGKAIIEVEITGPNPSVTAYLDGFLFLAEPCAKLTTDKQVYIAGETVTLIFTNSCDHTITLNCDRPWRIVDKDGKVVYAPEIVLWVEVPINPGGTKTWEWDQKGMGKVRKQVEEDTYTAELDTDAGTYSATFEIRACSPATLTVQASDLTNPITGVTIKVQPNDLNGQSAGNTPFTRRYCVGDRVTLEVQFTNVANCEWKNYVFQYWQVKKDVRIVSLSGECKGKAAIVEIEITGPNPTLTAYLAGFLFPPEPCATLTTDKQVYNSGETVTLTFTNNCSVTLTLNCDSPWRIADSSGAVVFKPDCVPSETSIAPGGTMTWTWDQKDSDGKQVVEKTYTAELDTVNAGTYATTFEVKKKPLICLGTTLLAGMLAAGAVMLLRKHEE